MFGIETLPSDQEPSVLIVVTGQVEEVSEYASKEYSLERTLDKMQHDWNGVKLEYIVWRNTGTYILSALDDIQMLLDDQIVKTQSMRASPYIGPFEDRVRLWEAQLDLTQVRTVFQCFARITLAIVSAYCMGTTIRHHNRSIRLDHIIVCWIAIDGNSSATLCPPSLPAEHFGRVAEVPAGLAVPGAHLWQRGHNATDAQRRTQIQGRGRDMAAVHAAHD